MFSSICLSSIHLLSLSVIFVFYVEYWFDNSCYALFFWLSRYILLLWFCVFYDFCILKSSSWILDWLRSGSFDWQSSFDLRGSNIHSFPSWWYIYPSKKISYPDIPNCLEASNTNDYSYLILFVSQVVQRLGFALLASWMICY